MYIVYSLEDPRDNLPFYVGITDNVYARFLQHLRCDGSNFRKDARIQELKAANKMVVMRTLQEVHSAVEAATREAYWINHFLQLGIPLYNNTIPTPLHLRSKREHRNTTRLIEGANALLLVSQDSKAEAVRELRAMGWGKQAALEKVWNVKPGGSPRYKEAEAEYNAIISQEGE
jgi:predicted GIY-YIG superfamily endonuclease